MIAPAATRSRATTALNGSALLWLLVAAASQLIFVAYILLFYGAGTVTGDMAVWSAIMRNGYIAGDNVGNTALIAHVLLAAYITVAGLLQLLPSVRRYAPRLHRWNGRCYFTIAVIMACSGLYLTWSRPAVAPLANDLAVSLNGILILLCAAYALRYAVQRDFVAHQRWAFRLFLVVSGVWFLRVMLFGWILLHQAPVGLGENLDGPMAIVFAYASTLLPLAVYELYRAAKRVPKSTAHGLTAGLLLVMTALTALGSVGSALILWLPRI